VQEREQKESIYMTKVGEGKRNKSKIDNKQIQNKNNRRVWEVTGQCSSVIQLPSAGPGDKGTQVCEIKDRKTK